MALRILLADDSMTAQNMGKKILTDAGFEVVTVSNGAAAVKKLAEAAPDIAILDVYMPGYTGLEVCERLKSAPATARVPVLLSVGKMEPFRPEDGMKVKADGVIIKPFEATDLVTVVNKLAERSYGPDGVVPPPPAADTSTDPLEEINILDEPAPAREGQAEGLETFTPVPTAAPTAVEAGIEFTSVQKVDVVVDDPSQDLVPTVLSPEASAGPVEVAIPEIDPVLPQTAAVLEEFPEILQAKAAAASVASTSPEAVAEAPAPRLEPIMSAPVAEVATVVETSAPAAGWAAVESELADQDLNLDLEAEMQAMAVQEPATIKEPVVTASTATAPESTLSAAAMPFLSPMGKTSFDELDAVMASVEESAVTTPAPLTAEVPASEAQDEILLGEELDATPAIPEPEIEPAAEALSDFADFAPVVEESALLDVMEPAAPEAPEPEGLLDVAPANPGAPVEESAALKDALAFYGLSDVSDEGGLQNPVNEADEPFFAVTEEVAEMQPGALEEEALAAEVAAAPESADVLDEIHAVPVVDELGVLDADEPVAAAAPVIVDPVVEAAPVAAPEPEPVIEEASLVEEAPALDFLEEAPPVEVAPEIEPEPLMPELEDLARAAAFEVAPAAVAAELEAQSVDAAPATSPSVDEAIVNTMVGRVVDRVVDRLKPVLTIMVEEILKEVKKK